MPSRQDHYSDHLLDVLIGYLIVKQITHGIDEDHPWFFPLKRFGKLFWNKSNIKTMFKGMTSHPAKPLGEPFGVAILAAGAYLRAPTDGIPSSICPFNCCIQRHVYSPKVRRAFVEVENRSTLVAKTVLLSCFLRTRPNGKSLLRHPS